MAIRAEKSVFDACMTREGKIVVADGGVNYRVFFRRNQAKNKPADHTTLYYGLSTAIEPGMLLYYNSVAMLVLNSETVENADYRRADAVRCNRTANLQVGAECENPNTGNTEFLWTTITGGADVPIYFEVKQVPRNDTGVAMEQSRYFAYIPAHFQLAPDNYAVQMYAFTATDVDMPYELKRYGIDTVDDSFAYRDSNNDFHGLVVCELNVMLAS